MNKKSMSKKVICLVIIGNMIIPNVVYGKETVNKDESVFVNLSQQGNVQEEIVSEWIHSDNPLSNIEDKSELKEIKNIKGTEKPNVNNENLTWNSEKKDLFYKGTTDKELPLKIDIKYYLNGEEMDPNEMAGKSGDVKIKIHLTNTKENRVTIKDKEKTIYTPFSTLTVVTLPTDVFSDVKTNSGQLLSEGNNNLVNFISFPGLKESLDIDYDSLNIDLPEELEITAKTNNFKMKPMFITATPELPDVKEFKNAETLDELKDGITKLKDSGEKLCEATLKMQDGSKQLRDGLHELQNGTNLAKEGVKKAQGDMAKSSDKLDLIRVPSNVNAERKLIDDSFMAMNMDTSLLKAVSPETIAVVNDMSKDFNEINFDEIKNNEMIKNLPKIIKNIDVNNVEKLIKDTEFLSSINMGELRPIMDLKTVKPQLKKLMEGATPLAKELKNLNVEKVESILGLMDQMPQLEKLIDEAKPLVNFDTKKLAPIYGVINNSEKIKGILSYAESLGEKDLGKLEELLSKQLEASQKDVKEIKEDLKVKVNDSDIKDKEKIDKIINESFNKNMSNTKKNILEIKNQLAGLKKLQSIIKSQQPLIEQMKAALSKQNINEISGAIKNLNKIKNDVSSEENKRTIAAISKSLSKENISKAKYALEKLEKIQTVMKDPKTKDVMKKLQKSVQSMDYIEKITPQLIGMRKDLDANRNNIDMLKGMVKTIKDPKTKVMMAKLNKIKESGSKLEETVNKLKKVATPDKLKNIPVMTKQLTSMQKDLVDNRKILEVVKDSLSEGNVYKANQLLNAIPSLTDGVNRLSEGVDKIVDGSEQLTDGSTQLNDGMNKFNDEGIKKIDDKATPKIEELEKIMDTKDAIVDLSKKYDNFTGKGEDMKGKVKFIMKTGEVKVPEIKHKAKKQVKKEKMGFFEWVKNLF